MTAQSFRLRNATGGHYRAILCRSSKIQRKEPLKGDVKSMIDSDTLQRLEKPDTHRDTRNYDLQK